MFSNQVCGACLSAHHLMAAKKQHSQLPEWWNDWYVTLRTILADIASLRVTGLLYQNAVDLCSDSCKKLSVTNSDVRPQTERTAKCLQVCAGLHQQALLLTVDTVRPHAERLRTRPGDTEI